MRTIARETLGSDTPDRQFYLVPVSESESEKRGGHFDRGDEPLRWAHHACCDLGGGGLIATRAGQRVRAIAPETAQRGGVAEVVGNEG